MTREIVRQHHQSTTKSNPTHSNSLQRRAFSRMSARKGVQDVRDFQTDSYEIRTYYNFLNTPLLGETKATIQSKKKHYSTCQTLQKGNVHPRAKEDVVVCQRMDYGASPPPPPPLPLLEETDLKKPQGMYETCLKRGMNLCEKLKNGTLTGGVSEEILTEQWKSYKHGTNLEPEYSKLGATSQTETPELGKYYNEVLKSEGEIKAHLNVKGTSEKAKTEMSPSDVLYKQFQAAGGKSLKRLSRTNVASGSGSYVILYLDKTQFKEEKGKDIMIEKNSPAYYALLGIENCTSVFYLIRQRGMQLGITGIKSLMLSADRKILEIDFLTQDDL
jgi:hypothetical protein